MRKKIDNAICSRDSDENGVLAFCEHVLFPIVSPKTVSFDGKDYDNYKSLFEEYNAGRISETSLKETVKVRIVFIFYSIVLRLERKIESGCCVFGIQCHQY